MVVPHRGSKRPFKVVDGFADRWRVQNLFHPDEFDDLVRAVDICLRYRDVGRDLDLENEARVLLSAKFGTMDVTYRVASMARENDGNLRVRGPPPVQGYQPSTFLYWYTRLFGDPSPRKTKYLEVTTADPQDRNDIQIKRLKENTPIILRLAV